MIDTEPRKLGIERYFLGELDIVESGELEVHLRECIQCRSYLDSLTKERNEFLRIYPFESATKLHLQKGKQVSWIQNAIDFLFRPALIPAYGFLLIAAIMTPILFTHFTKKSTTEYSDISYKGGPILSFVYNHNGEIIQGDLNRVYNENDKIQVMYSSVRDQYISLFSIDNKGELSFYQEDRHSSICSVHSGKGDLLSFPGSIVLDNTTGEELIIAVFSNEPLKTADVQTWVHKYSKGLLGDLPSFDKVIKKNPLAKKTQIATLLLKKGR